MSDVFLGGIMPEFAVINIHYELSSPVEIGAFTGSLDAMAELYKVRLSRHDDAPKDLKLFIREIRKGSIDVDLVEMVKTVGGLLAPVMADSHTIVETFDQAKKIFGWLKGDEEKPDDLSKKEIESASRFLAPVAENKGSSVSINVKDSPGAQILIGSIDANAMQNQAWRAVAEMKQPLKQTLHEVPLVWHQTDRDGGSLAGRTGLKAIIEDVSPSPMPVYFTETERDELKAKMIDDVEFPYRKVFMVDVETIVVLEKLKGYKILKLHDTLDN